MSQSGKQAVISGRVSKKSASKPAVSASKHSTKSATSASNPPFKSIASVLKRNQTSDTSQAKTPSQSKSQGRLPSKIQPIASQILPTPSQTHRRQRRHISVSEDGDEETEEDAEEAAIGSKPRRASDTTTTTLRMDDDEELDAIDREEQDLAEAENSVPLGSARRSKKKQKDKIKVQRDAVYQRQSNLSEDVKGRFVNLEITCRIMFLVDFDLSASKIIKAVWGENVQQSDWEWDESCNRIGWNSSNWKKRCILNMERRIRGYIRADKQNTLASITEYKPLANFFASKYSPSSFTDVFNFIDECIDIAETEKAHRECKIFFKTIYANFGTRVKRYMDWAADPERLFESPSSRRNLLLWFNRMADSQRFKVEPDMFVRLEDRKRKTRPSNMPNAPPAPDEDRNYVFFDREDGEDGGTDAEDAGGVADEEGEG